MLGDALPAKIAAASRTAHDRFTVPVIGAFLKNQIHLIA
jgi:hypothetical protein